MWPPRFGVSNATLPGHLGPEVTPEGARRRLETFQRTLARALQQAHLETVQELTLG